MIPNTNSEHKNLLLEENQTLEAHLVERFWTNKTIYIEAGPLKKTSKKS